MGETVIIEKLDETGYMRRSNLVQTIIEEHQGEMGFSKANIEKKIARLVKDGKISKLGIDDLHTFGIKETDKNASYLVSPRYLHLMKFMDIVMDKLQTKNYHIVGVSLEEIVRYQDQYTLTPHQLDKLVLLLGENYDFTASTLAIISDYVFLKNIYPSNSSQFRENLKLTVEMFKDTPVYDPLCDLPYVSLFQNNPQKREVYKNAIMILGIYQDDFVVERLIADCKGDFGRLEKLYDCYSNQSTAQIIESHNIELFKVQTELREKRNEENALMLSYIRSDATNFVFKKPQSKLNETTNDSRREEQ